VTGSTVPADPTGKKRKRGGGVGGDVPPGPLPGLLGREHGPVGDGAPGPADVGGVGGGPVPAVGGIVNPPPPPPSSSVVAVPPPPSSRRAYSLAIPTVSEVIVRKVLNKVRKTRNISSLRMLMSLPKGRARRSKHDDITATVVDLSGFVS